MSSTPRVISVDIPHHEYDITVQPGLLSAVGPHLRNLSRSSKVAIVTDSNVAPIYLAALQSSLKSAGFQSVSATIPPGEDHKTLQNLSTIYDQLLAASIDRYTPLLALGGGLVGDMAGFAAATLLRGLPFLQIPTTLLSMVDASVGGKTGVNHTVGKNLIGAFHQPIAVLIDPNTLKTLPLRELRSGLAECIKHDIIRDPQGFAHLEKNISRALNLDTDYLADLVAHNVAIKSRVVSTDPLERGQRAHLNLGHTFGHAIETVSHFSYSHGQAIALGTIAASRLAASLRMLDQPSVDRIVSIFAAASLPTSGLTLDPDAIIDTMAFDKKMRAGRIRFVLPTSIGSVTIRDDVPTDLIRRALESLK